MNRTVRDVRTSRSALHRYRAERLLRQGFAERRAKVLVVVRARLRAHAVRLDPSDLEACYSQAWHGLYARVLSGERIEDPSAWLVLATFRRAIDEARSLGRERARAAAAAAATPTAPGVGIVAGADEQSGERDLAGELDDRARLRELFEGLCLRLSEREREAASLCYLQGLSRAQAAAQMGIGEARMRKLMEGRGDGEPGVAAKVGELAATIRAGGWCEQQSSLLRAYAFGILDPDGERHALAVAHTRECPACRAQVALLRGLASVLPPLPLALPLGGGGRPRRDRARHVGARHVRALARRLLPRGVGGGAAPAAKLAVVAVALVGAGSVYVAAHASTAPLASAAPGGANRAAATAPVFVSSGNLLAYPPLLRERPPLFFARAKAGATSVGSTSASSTASGLAKLVHRADRRQSGRSGRSSASDATRLQTPGASRTGTVAPVSSPPEFSPERVSGQPPSDGESAVSSSSPAPSGGNGEFGIEPGR